MIDFTARRLLPDLVDGCLHRSVEARVRGHTQGCARCRRILRELEESERLLRELPAVLAPLDESRTAEARLVRLARWARNPPATRILEIDHAENRNDMALKKNAQ